ncbi:uncharacterized protein STEHIDRAFT_116183 [Stereum hirsutum FP-91666 SS1]|uniref:Uncharacterized protein n=1 Tax=Stereum hirsutum (strain FP-91666) TaxID=721885 RepID=R7RYL3_STEHR|nr:uncharacterized protein STEHIDRAFT_116183 [Stereum hirsutum FP-91666 SS1]EIM79995.1 hypothetical protein STEHIDRAFT_116183 [Stereum hirsutum FP-91666 SS1]
MAETQVQNPAPNSAQAQDWDRWWNPAPLILGASGFLSSGLCPPSCLQWPRARDGHAEGERQDEHQENCISLKRAREEWKDCVSQDVAIGLAQLALLSISSNANLFTLGPLATMFFAISSLAALQSFITAVGLLYIMKGADISLPNAGTCYLATALFKVPWLAWLVSIAFNLCMMASVVWHSGWKDAVIVFIVLSTIGVIATIVLRWLSTYALPATVHGNNSDSMALQVTSQP